MSIFTISDLHLSFGSDKPMDIFRGWDNHTERLFANWNRLVNPKDTVILPGDFSWALKLEDTKADFDFLKKLTGASSKTVDQVITRSLTRGRYKARGFKVDAGV